MIIHKMYLGDAFGWDTENKAKVAISQLRENNLIKTQKCPKAQLIKNESIRWQPNTLKFLGYIPIINIIAGIIAISASKNASLGLGPNHASRWKARGVAMIIGGPLLFIIDLIKFVYDQTIIKSYQKAHPQLMNAFNTSHGHTPAYWPGHPIFCQ